MLNRVTGFFRSGRPRGPSRLDRIELAQLLSRFPALRDLEQQHQARLIIRAREILEAKSFLGADGFEPTDQDCAAIALLAALPIAKRGLRWYEQFHTFIVYPDAFVSEIEEVDEQGLVHVGRDLRSGEAWQRGPVVLAMSDVWQSGQGHGFNVVVHELAHQIDHRNGDADGFPLLPQSMRQDTWTEAFTAAWDRLNAEIEQGIQPGLDPYAAESPAEFFAVASEMFFDAPDWLRGDYPALHHQLSALYGYSP